MEEQKKYRTQAFTLVELIIVISILAILAVIAFISFQWYVKNAKDGKRISELSEVRSGIELFLAQKPKLPNPDNEKISAYWQDGNLIFMQGCLWENSKQSLRVIWDASNDAWVCYTYTVNGNKDKYQLTAYLENDPQTIAFYQTYADSIDYTQRFIYTIGTYVVVFPSGSKQPLQNDPDIIDEDEENGGKQITFSEESGDEYDIISTWDVSPVTTSWSQIPEVIDDIVNPPSQGGGNTPGGGLTNQNSNCFDLGSVIDPDTGEPVDGEFAIVKYKFDEPGCSQTSVTITDTINNQLITEIWDGAFCDEWIWDYDFSCNNFWSYQWTIQNITFNTQSVKRFWEQAFGYNNITHISLPESLLYPGKLAFIGNPLEEIRMPLKVFNERASEWWMTFPLETLKRFYIWNNYFDFASHPSEKIVYHLENGSTEESQYAFSTYHGGWYHSITPSNLDIAKNIDPEEDNIGKINFTREDPGVWSISMVWNWESKFFPLFWPNR